LQPIRSYDAAGKDMVKLIPVVNAYRVSGYSMFDGDKMNDVAFPLTTSSNPSTGIVVYYHLGDNADSVKKLSIEIKDATGNVVRTFSNKSAERKTSNNSIQNEPLLSVKKGLNRFVWDQRRMDMPTIDNVYIEGSYSGGKIAPGNYSITLKVDGQEQSLPFVLKSDPRVKSTAADYTKQETFLKKVEADVTDIHVAVVRMRNLTKQIQGLIDLLDADKSKEPIVKQGKSIIEKIGKWEEQLIQSKSQSYDDVINFVNKLSANFIFVHGEASSTIPYITTGHEARFVELHDEWMKYKSGMEQLLLTDVSSFNELCRSLKVDHVLLPE
jgi:hypothetical protein